MISWTTNLCMPSNQLLHNHFELIQAANQIARFEVRRMGHFLCDLFLFVFQFQRHSPQMLVHIKHLLTELKSYTSQYIKAKLLTVDTLHKLYIIIEI